MPAAGLYTATASGGGPVEANPRNVAGAVSKPASFTRVAVVECQRANAGDPLFNLDTRSAVADWRRPNGM
ncbi:hypothetical protein [Defluviicoccus vanus]|uniref:Uncharacterized protein n=1 Tax=Defluviicoccus vanus TaxID=111831 RepID=A0A7H1N395_9PROT|nr:hypothetical protein [Defluviicoccus vanus]QNT70181.1 hypothetical protein HQ394_13695 [Defluviicoccus vanus]